MSDVATRPLHPAVRPLRWHHIDVEVAAHIGNQLFELGLADRKTEHFLAFLQPREMVIMVVPDTPEMAHEGSAA